MYIHLILKYFNINISENSEYIINYSFNVFLLLLVLLLSFLNIIGYYITIILINKQELVTKFTKLKRIINTYEKTNVFFCFNLNFTLFSYNNIIIFFILKFYEIYSLKFLFNITIKVNPPLFNNVKIYLNLV